ncbi:MAG: flagellin [Lachnospiraceae bacterium]|nr:flagellin [Lachnospiraceae bacterium]MBR5368961.1 flagellin [Lachnospiraceae bacterium]
MIVQHNMSAANTNRQLGITNGNLSKSTEKLSSGYRINRAGDDAAGLSISEKMRGQIRGLEQGSTNAQDGISLIQTAEGALNEVHSVLQRMRELAVQGSNDTNVTEDRTSIYEEMEQLAKEINRIGCTTEFNTMKLFASAEMIEGMQGDLGELEYNTDKASEKFESMISLANLEEEVNANLQVGANSAQSIKFRMGTLDTSKLNYPGAEDGEEVNLASFSDGVIEGGTLYNIKEKLDAGVDSSSFEDVHKAFTAAVTDIDIATSFVSKSRSYLGAIQNRLEHTIANADNTAENLQASESRIRDVNMAEEMVQYSKSSILQQAGQSMLAQANQSTQGVLTLLR